VILVDPLREYTTSLRYKQWCHMVSTDSLDELHAFAAKLGLKREWAQLRPKVSAAHYDLVPSKRAIAVRLGAREVTARELVMQNFDGLRRRPRCGKIVDSNDTTPGARFSVAHLCVRVEGHLGPCDSTGGLK
jgi:hypothetical protein